MAWLRGINQTLLEIKSNSSFTFSTTNRTFKIYHHKEWGADRKTLLLLYRSLIRSQMDYGNFIYQSARKCYVKTLDPIYHRGLWLVLGAFRTSPVVSLYTEANKAPANIRNHKLALYVKLKSCPANPAHINTFYPKNKELF